MRSVTIETRLRRAKIAWGLWLAAVLVATFALGGTFLNAVYACLSGVPVLYMYLRRAARLARQAAEDSA